MWINVDNLLIISHLMLVCEGVNMYSCEVCSEIFSWPSGLSRHTRIHKNHSFRCDLCNKIFKRKDSLRRHMQRVHAADEVASKNISSPAFEEELSRGKYFFHDGYKTNEELENSTVPPVAPLKMQSSEHPVARRRKSDNYYQTSETMEWDSDINPKDIVDLMRVKMSRGENVHHLVNALVDMGIIMEPKSRNLQTLHPAFSPPEQYF